MRTEAPAITAYHLTLLAHRDSGSSTLFEKLLDDVSLEVGKSTWNEVVGPSGGGKSLLFSVLSLRQQPDDGKLLVNGRNFDRLGRRGVADLRREVGSAGQSPLLLERRTVLENLVLPFVVRREESKAVETSNALLEEMGLAQLRDRRVWDLSHQERLLVGVMRAVVTRPRLILVDGIMEQLDEAARDAVMRLLRRRHMDGAAVILFGREPTQSAERGSVLRMVGGRIEAEESESPRVAPAPEDQRARV